MLSQIFLYLNMSLYFICHKLLQRKACGMALFPAPYTYQAYYQLFSHGSGI